MKRLMVCGVSLVIFAAVSMEPVQAATPQFVASLSGENEVPPVESDGFSVAFFSFQRVLGRDRLITVRFDLGTLSGPVVAAHIHNAPAGENGPIVVDFENGSVVSSAFLNININSADDLVGPLEGQTLGDLREIIEDGDAYINVHTEQHPTGEIRGQIEVND